MGKMVNCKSCGAEIASSAKVCPSCGGKNKSQIYKKWWFWLAIAVVVIAIGSSAGNNNSTNVDSETNATQQSTESKANNDSNSNASNDIFSDIKETVGQKNAVKKAKNYLKVSAFSYDGLIKQLEFEKFSHEDAVYGADNCGADWNEQAAKKAESYIDLTSFSREGLIDQLLFEGFTQEQAEYGVTAVGY